MDRRKNEKLNDLEEEAKENAEHLLSKANEMRQEQEDEIKHLNEVYNVFKKLIFIYIFFIMLVSHKKLRWSI